MPTDIGHYNSGAWPNGGGHAGGIPFDLLDSSMNPVALQSGLLNQLLVAAELAQFNAAGWHQPNSNYHGFIQAVLHQFLHDRRSAEETEALDHKRNDCLMGLIIESSGLQLLPHRDSITSPTSDRSRLDCNLAVLNCPPYVLLEEKATTMELNDARTDLVNKFRWLKHYDSLPFVFAIAIGGNNIEFGQLGKDGAYTAFKLPGGLLDACFNTDEVGSIDGALKCVLAAINIGRYIHFLHQNCPPAGLGVGKFNTTIQRPNNKSLRITFDHVAKRYGTITKIEKERMKAFYHDTRNVACIEKGVVLDNAKGQVKFKVTPVGIMQFPIPADGGGLRRCLKDILTALAGAHAAGWIIVDVRRPNVIYAHDITTNSDRYFLIDACEFATKIGSAVPVGHIAHPPAGWPGAPNLANTKWDLLMLTQLFSAAAYTAALDTLPHGAAFRAMLSAGITPASAMLGHAFFAGLIP